MTLNDVSMPPLPWSELLDRPFAERLDGLVEGPDDLRIVVFAEFSGAASMPTTEACVTSHGSGWRPNLETEHWFNHDLDPDYPTRTPPTRKT